MLLFSKQIDFYKNEKIMPSDNNTFYTRINQMYFLAQNYKIIEF